MRDEKEGGGSTGGGFAKHCENNVAVGENEVFWYTISTGTWTVVTLPAATEDNHNVNIPRKLSDLQNVTGGRRSLVGQRH